MSDISIHKTKNKAKIARICWNTEEWRRPSGSKGKSRSANSYENIIGFGHEEWLLDNTRIMPNGFHYAFLQPMNAKKHHHNVYDIHLFTKSPDGTKLYVGCLRNAEGVTPEESTKVYHHYLFNGWLKEMKEDVIFVGGQVKDFEPGFMFNVKFRFEEAEIIRTDLPIIKNNNIGHRYNLYDLPDILEFEINKENGKPKTLNTSEFWRTNSAGKTLIDPLHKKMQNAVQALLEEDYVNLSLEVNNVDMKGQPKGGGKDCWHFFEFKTYSAKRSIRQALGQIIEYAHYPSNHRAEKLFVIGPEKPKEQDITYLKFLRETYHIPLWYRWYSFDQDVLHKEV